MLYYQRNLENIIELSAVDFELTMAFSFFAGAECWGKKWVVFIEIEISFKLFAPCNWWKEIPWKNKKYR